MRADCSVRDRTSKASTRFRSEDPSMNSRYPLFDFVAESPLPCPFTIDDGVTVTTNNIDIDAIHPHVMSEVDRVHISPTECDYCLIVDETKHDPKVASLFVTVHGFPSTQ